MLIAQITDLHLGFEPGNPRELSQTRMEAVLEAILALDVRPDLVIATGDLADKGAIEAYRRLRKALSALPMPAFTLIGNHDERANYLSVFPESEGPGGFAQYVIEDFPVRVVVLDTLEEGRHGGAFCETRAAWLEARLAEAPDQPTLIALHHPPVDTGIPWMGAVAGEPWTERLTAAVSGHSNVVAVISGHMHRPIATGWAGTTLIVSPPVAPDLVMTFKPVDAEVMDGRPLIELGPPAFALHQWRNGRILTHYEMAYERRILARYDEKMHDLVKHLAEERGEI